MKKKLRLRVACIQLNAGADWIENWKKTKKLLTTAICSDAELIVLPENFIARVSESKINFLTREAVPEVLSLIQKMARQERCVIVAGSVPEILPHMKKNIQKTANTCFVFSKEGKQILSYQKMHLFDVNLPGVSVQESRTVSAGDKPGLFRVKNIQAGVGICYDLRFPEYFRLLSQKGAELLILPANFTAETGKTAWEVLLRARAIENQCYVVAAGQCGRHPDSGMMSYGNSMMIDPLGRVIQKGSFSRQGVLVADLDLSLLRAWRKQFPVLQHRKIRYF